MRKLLRWRIAAALLGASYAWLLIWALLGALFLSGCASGVQLSDEDRITCRNEGCAAFSERELTELVNKAAAIGYRKGWTDALRQSLKDI